MINIPKKMLALRLIKYRHPFVKDTIPVPQINDNEVLVSIRASSLNPIDYTIQSGKIKIIMPYKLPITVGNDFSGTVVRVGKKVTKFKLDDQVYGRPDDFQSGTLTEFIAINENDIAKTPRNLSLTDASAVPLTGLTSYQALIEIGKLKKGQKVFIQAGSGGVGTMAIQIAKAVGAYVATTTSKKNFDLVRSLGADQVIDYHTTDFSEVLKNYDSAFDTQGGKTLSKTFKILKPGGKLVTVNGIPTFKFGAQHHLGLLKSILFGIASSPLKLLAKKYHVEYTFFIMHPSGRQLDLLTNMIENHELKPIVDRAFPFSEVFEGFKLLESHHATGKVIIEMK
ncbi:alcohol dehydrogenase, zinc-containing [Fructilactobacillus fructivorans]|uniref:NADP-dependent oxidoreductase n=1 Tax=Fructilactobacillus fructivorans TaxID=1614 RepID=UPI0007144407|nr:NADP-dependent oxidoreductase [Fructilactobacillus fructivorans]KRN13185.1 alcohol dehydrogenase, zinc-containing [Fructilactobacillus fructivorans]